MKKEELFEAIGKINSETVEKNAPYKSNGNKMVKMSLRNMKKWTALAASLAVIAGSGFFAYHQMRGNNEIANPNETVDIADSSQNSVSEQEPQEKIVDISSLLLAKGGVNQLQASLNAQVKMNNYTALYEGASSVSGDILADSLGKELPENEGWYRVSGHEELQYLIEESNGEYTLWKFSSFLSEEYPYKDVLELVYGSTSVEDISHITVTAATMDNTDEGKRIQEEIGQYEITDPEALQQIYGILQGMTCYGHNRWDLIDYGENDEDMTESVRLGRYLTIELNNGVSIDTLKYTAVSGVFYEFGGVAYNKLSDSDKELVDKVLGIEMILSDDAKEQSDIQSFDESTDEQAETVTGFSDVPVDEWTYQEAHRYSDEIEELQSAISQAMTSGELPFVISSGIYENPVRVVVTVNTREEALIEIIKAYDKTGGLIEVVYSEEKGVVDLDSKR